MNDKNSTELLAKSDIDGGLIGGASLKAESFINIVKSAVI
jgi:triosephosphate isomerase